MKRTCTDYVGQIAHGSIFTFDLSIGDLSPINPVMTCYIAVMISHKLCNRGFPRQPNKREANSASHGVRSTNCGISMHSFTSITLSISSTWTGSIVLTSLCFNLVECLARGWLENYQNYTILPLTLAAITLIQSDKDYVKFSIIRARNYKQFFEKVVWNPDHMDVTGLPRSSPNADQFWSILIKIVLFTEIGRHWQVFQINFWILTGIDRHWAMKMPECWPPSHVVPSLPVFLAHQMMSWCHAVTNWWTDRQTCRQTHQTYFIPPTADTGGNDHEMRGLTLI